MARKHQQQLFFASCIFLSCLLLGLIQPYINIYVSPASPSLTDSDSTSSTTSPLVVLEAPLQKNFANTDPKPALIATSDFGSDDTASHVKALTIHIVQSGETLSSISNHYFGTPKYWKEIYKANKSEIPNKNKIKPGLQLAIPERPPAGSH